MQPQRQACQCSFKMTEAPESAHHVEHCCAESSEPALGWEGKAWGEMPEDCWDFLATNLVGMRDRIYNQ